MNPMQGKFALRMFLVLSGLLVVAFVVPVLIEKYQGSRPVDRSFTDSRFAPTWRGRVPGCVNVKFIESVGREQAISLLRQLGIEIPAELLKAVEPLGPFVPTIEIVVRDFDRVVAMLKKDPAIVDVRLNYVHVGGDHHASVLFSDLMTADQAYQLLTGKHQFLANGYGASYGVKNAVARLAVAPGTEDATVKALRSSDIVQDALQCPTAPPAHYPQ